MWVVVLFWLLSRFVLMISPFTDRVSCAIYFISNDIFLVFFFRELVRMVSTIRMQKQKSIRGLMMGAFYYSIGLAVDDILLYFGGIGDVSKWYYMAVLLLLTIIGYRNGATTD